MTISPPSSSPLQFEERSVLPSHRTDDIKKATSPGNEVAILLLITNRKYGKDL